MTLLFISLHCPGILSQSSRQGSILRMNLKEPVVLLNENGCFETTFLCRKTRTYPYLIPATPYYLESVSCDTFKNSVGETVVMNAQHMLFLCRKTKQNSINSPVTT